MSDNIRIYDIESFPNFFLAGFTNIEKEFFHKFAVGEAGQEEFNNIRKIKTYVEDKWLVGFNSRMYDNQLIEYILRSDEEFLARPPAIIAQDLFELTKDIIENDNTRFVWDISFSAIDLKRVGNIDKSLKMCGVDMKHHNIQDLPYAHDKHIEENELDKVVSYNWNDLDTTTDMYHELRDDIKMRRELSLKYGTNVMDYADSGVADRLLGKFYSQETGLSFWDFVKSSTERDWVDISEIVTDKIRFQSDNLKKLLESVKSARLNADSKFERTVKIGDTKYDMLKGGLHSVRQPEIFESTDDMQIYEADVSSYYPNAMILHGIKPAHLREEFLDILKDITHTRLQAKKNEDWVTSDGLKITINSVFGKMGYPYSWMYDIKAMFGVTINCQLYLLMLIEMLEQNDFEVFYGNTDGIFTKVPNNRYDEYEYICRRWQEYTGFDLDFEPYRKCVIRDVNNYLIEKESGDLKMKGAFDTERWEDLGKGYKYPIVPYAVKEYFINDISVRETIQNHQDILDFCIAQKPGSKFDIYFDQIIDGKYSRTRQQKTNRYYIGKGGGSLVKKSGSKEIQMVSGQPVVLLNKYDENVSIEEYNIKHRYYIREANKIINEFNTKQTSLF